MLPSDCVFLPDMNFLKNVSGSLYLNSSTISGCCDVVAVKFDNDENIMSSPLHVRFGMDFVRTCKHSTVFITVNGEPVKCGMRLGKDGEAYFLYRVDPEVQVCSSGNLSNSSTLAGSNVAQLHKNESIECLVPPQDPYVSPADSPAPCCDDEEMGPPSDLASSYMMMESAEEMVQSNRSSIASSMEMPVPHSSSPSSSTSSFRPSSPRIETSSQRTPPLKENNANNNNTSSNSSRTINQVSEWDMTSMPSDKVLEMKWHATVDEVRELRVNQLKPSPDLLRRSLDTLSSSSPPPPTSSSPSSFTSSSSGRMFAPSQQNTSPSSAVQHPTLTRSHSHSESATDMSMPSPTKMNMAASVVAAASSNPSAQTDLSDGSPPLRFSAPPINQLDLTLSIPEDFEQPSSSSVTEHPHSTNLQSSKHGSFDTADTSQRTPMVGSPHVIDVPDECKPPNEMSELVFPIIINNQSKFSKRMQVEAGQCVIVAFTCVSRDIMFSASLLPSSSSTTTTTGNNDQKRIQIFKQSRDAYGHEHIYGFVAQQSGSVDFSWDNSYSYFRKKQLNIQIVKFSGRVPSDFSVVFNTKYGPLRLVRVRKDGMAELSHTTMENFRLYESVERLVSLPVVSRVADKEVVGRDIEIPIVSFCKEYLNDSMSAQEMLPIIHKYAKTLEEISSNPDALDDPNIVYFYDSRIIPVEEAANLFARRAELERESGYDKRSYSPPPDGGTTFISVRNELGEEETVCVSKSLRLPIEVLRKMKMGENTLTFTVGSSDSRKTQQCRLFMYNTRTKFVVCDIDGTITRSDMMGHVMYAINRDWTHDHIARLLTKLKDNGYDILYLTARAVSQIRATRHYLESIKQNGYTVPPGPIICSDKQMLASLIREVVLRKPDKFKIPALENIRELFHKEYNPFAGGFGNRITDTKCYLKVKIPSDRIFQVNPQGVVIQRPDLSSDDTVISSYERIADMIDEYFPPIPCSNLTRSNAVENEEYDALDDDSARGTHGYNSEATEMSDIHVTSDESVVIVNEPSVSISKETDNMSSSDETRHKTKPSNSLDEGPPVSLTTNPSSNHSVDGVNSVNGPPSSLIFDTSICSNIVPTSVIAYVHEKPVDGIQNYIRENSMGIVNSSNSSSMEQEDL